MVAKFFTNFLLPALLLGGESLASTITPAPKPTCPAKCTIEMYAFEHWYWQSIVLTTTYTHTVVLIVDEEHHTTLTSTKLVAIPASENINKPYPTNLQGTVTTMIGSHSTILAYPTELIDYPNGYTVSGTYNSSGKCYTDPFITWKSQDLTSLTQPAVSTPSGGDKFGTLYTIAGTLGAWPSGWLESRLKDTLPSVCGLASIAPESAVQGALLLTTTSISTLKNTNTASSTPAPSSTPKQTSTAKETTPFAVQDSSKTSKMSASTPTSSAFQIAAPIVIGSTTVQVSVQHPQPGTSSQAIVIGTQTVAIGSTLTVGGMTVVAQTGSDAAPQIVYGTTTVIVAPTTTTTDGGMGSYIMSGISGPKTSSGSGSISSSTSREPFLQATGAAPRIVAGVQGGGLWYTLMMALLSIF